MVTAAADLCAVALSPGHAVLLADGTADIPLDRLWGAVRGLVNYDGSIHSQRDLAIALRKLAGCPIASPEDAAAAEAEAVWLRVRRWCVKNGQSNVHTGVIEMPDAGTEVGGTLTARELQALTLAGGINRVVCSRDTDDEKWCHKAFCESYRLSPAINDARSALQAAPGRVRELAEGLGASLAMGRVQ